MKKFGKYEKRPEVVPAKQPKVKNALLQTYLTSLLCMVLCVTMLIGTSYAWFTSEVENTGNEIYIGILDVELEKKEGDNWVSLSDTDASGANKNKLFDGSIRWEPGYTALETVRVVDKGDLAFRYELTFSDGKINGNTEDELQAVAKWFDVWVYHDDANAIPESKSYAEITAEDSGWEKIGNLAEVLGGKTVFKGTMEKEDVADKETAHTYTIALHMNGEQVNKDQEAALNALMGQKLELSVKLVASQRDSEQDGFGNADYDATMETVEVTPENFEQMDFAKNNTVYQFVGNFEDISIETQAGLNQVYDGSRVTSMGVFKLGYVGGVAHSYDSVMGVKRTGSYTIENFTATSICTAVYNTSVNLLNNTVEFINVDSANVSVAIEGNTIDGKNTGHTSYQGGNNEYGIYIYAIDYTLSFAGNEISGTKSHAIGINGRIGNNDFGDAADAAHSNIVEKFEKNTISVSVTGKSALKIWGDGKYTPNGSELSQSAKELMKLVEAGTNTITKADGAYNFCFDQVKITDYTVSD